MLENVSNLALPIFAFYLITFCNFTKELIGCKIQDYLNKNMYGKHLIGFILLLFLVILSDPSNTEKNILSNIGYSILIYALFMITTKLSFSLMIVVLVLLLSLYVVGNISKKRKEEQTKQKEAEGSESKETRPLQTDSLETVKAVLISLMGVITVVGFGIYFIEKKREYGKTFSLEKFILGVPVCRNYTPESAKMIK